METVKDRLVAFLKAKHISNARITRELGVSPAYINAMRKSLPEEKAARLCKLYPDLNREWLLFGEGDMLLPVQHAAPMPDSSSGTQVPLLPVKAFAGRLQNWSDGVMRSDCEMILSPVGEVDCAIRISGDSMEPELHDGSVLFIKRINEKAFIPWGNPMVIDSENGVLVKALYPIPAADDFLEARSFNPNYPPIRLPAASIYALYRVVASIKHYATV